MQILAGNDVGCIEIPTLEDTNDEGNEQFTVSAEPAGQDSGRFFVSLGAATVIIEDDDVVGKTEALVYFFRGRERERERERLRCWWVGLLGLIYHELFCFSNPEYFNLSSTVLFL